MNLTRIRYVLARILLGIAYGSAMLQWLWVLLVALPPLIESGAFELLTSSESTPVISAEPVEASPITWIFVGVITLFMLGLTILLLIRLPRTIMRTGERVVHQAAEVVIPVITHHKALPAKKRRVLSRRVVLAIQLVASLAPAVTSFLLPPVDELTRPIIVTTASILAIMSIVGFLLARLIEPPRAATSRTRSHASRG